MRLLPFLLMGALLSCNQDADKLRGEVAASSAIDVSHRITEFDSDVTGEGDTLVVYGRDLTAVKRVIMGDRVSPHVEASELSLSFVVPEDIPLGMQEIVLVFSGSERARAQIEVVPLPVISAIDPLIADFGEEVIIQGNNLNYVEQILIGEIPVQIGEKSSQRLSLTIPHGINGGLVSLMSHAGSATYAQPFIPCKEVPENPMCQPLQNINGSFEIGEAGAIPSMEVPGWGFNGIGTLAEFEIVDGMSSGGRRSLKVNVLEVGQSPWDIEARQESFEVQPGKTYRYSIRIWGPPHASVAFTAGLPDYSELARVEHTCIGGKWEEVSFEFSTGVDETAIRLPIHLSMESNQDAIFYLDNLRLIILDG